MIDPIKGEVAFGAYSLGFEPPRPDGNGVIAVVPLHAISKGDGTLSILSAQV